MNRGQEGMDQGIEIFMAPGWKVNERHVAIEWLGMPLTAIDGDLVPAFRQTRRKLFGKRLEATIPRRNSSCAENGNPRRLRAPGFWLLDASLVPRRLCTSQGARLSGRTADRLIAEPTGDVIVVHAFATHDFTPLGH